MNIPIEGERRGYIARWLKRLEASQGIIRMVFLGVTAVSTMDLLMIALLVIGFCVAIAVLITLWKHQGRDSWGGLAVSDSNKQIPEYHYPLDEYDIDHLNAGKPVYKRIGEDALIILYKEGSEVQE